MPEPEHLSNHHRTTLRQVFQHPVSHNIEWRSVVSLLEAVGSVEAHHDGKVAVKGWAETSEVTVLEIAQRFEDAGVAAIIFTDIARDGLLKGLNLDATIALAECISIPVIASGGFASMDDVRALTAPRAQILEGAIVGRALYDGRLDAAEALAVLRTARATV